MRLLHSGRAWDKLMMVLITSRKYLISANDITIRSWPTKLHSDIYIGALSKAAHKRIAGVC